ncbi:STAS domain-containing protein [Hymenobacter sublimis]|uniref:STAS domain-containing protein n=1 Tax=Hymenobacter sublimis TaxID=2933777 RepID=A0ABY4J6V3_9BACT|nr:STAS domain-containing protein [Hymenobacter sublimis]UPL47537.1 hypothetical protein MWH26_10025 [Hymenobacter sublimis]
MLRASNKPASSLILYNVDLNTTDPVALARRLVRTLPGSQPRLRIDCSRLKCLHTLGVSYLASQLLLTRQAGATVVLYNVGPVLEHSLRLLRLDQLFELRAAEAGNKARPA